jgi:hypothetical protein
MEILNINENNFENIPKVKIGRPLSKNVMIDKNAYQRQYYNENKKKFCIEMKCECCNVIILRNNKSNHEKRKIHLENLAKFNLCKN